MVEVIVTLVVVAILASIAIVGGKALVVRAQDASAQFTAEQVLREARVLAAQRNAATTWADSDLTTSISDLPSAAAPGVSANTGPFTAVKSGPVACVPEGQANWPFDSPPDPYASPNPSLQRCIVPAAIGDTHTVSWAISLDAATAGVALRSESGHAVYARARLSGAIESRSVDGVPDVQVIGAIALDGSVYDGSFVPAQPGPSAPTGLVATPANMAVDLAWNPNPETDINHYVVYRDGTQIAVSPTPAYTDTAVTFGSTYTYRVSAVNDSGAESPQSDPATAGPYRSTDLTFVSPGDDNGLVYWKGTRGRTVPFTNPAFNGGLNEDAPADGNGSGQASLATDRNDATFSLASVAGATDVFDLGTRDGFQLNHYTMRTLVNWASIWRSWVVEGSADGTNWAVLDSHTNDPKIATWNAWYDFAVTPGAHYRYVRFRSTGVNAGGWQGTAAAEVELYGNLREDPWPAGPAGNTALTFHDFGANDGLIRWLGTNKGTQAFTNPSQTDRLQLFTNDYETYQSRLPEYLVDENLSTYYDSATLPASDGAVLGFDLGPYQTFHPNYYTFRPALDVNSFPRSWVLEGSDDGVAWTTLDSHTGDQTVWSANTWYGFWPANVAASWHKLRIRIIATKGTNEKLSEVELYGNYSSTTPAVPDGTPLLMSTMGDTNGVFHWLGTNAGVQAWANPHNSFETGQASDFLCVPTPLCGTSFAWAGKLTDGNLTSTWTSNALPGSAQTSWDFGSNRFTPAFYTLHPKADAAKTGNTNIWDDWAMEGSNDGVAWTVLDSHTNEWQHMFPPAEWHGFWVENASAYRFLRLNVSETRGGGHTYEMGEVELYGYQTSASPPPLANTIRTSYTGMMTASDHDMFWLVGSNGGSQAWSNPVPGLVPYTVSSKVSGTYPEKGTSRPTDPRLNDVWNTNTNMSGQWIAWDLGPSRSVRVTDYMVYLYHDCLATSGTTCLRNWALQGSVDGTSWTDIDARANDKAMATHTNPGTSQETGVHYWPTGDTTTSFRWLRLIRTGPNSGGDQAGSLTQIRVYGDVSGY